MAQITLFSQREEALRPLIESAIEDQLSVLEVGMRQTQHRIQAFEKQFGLKTDDFVRQYADDAFQETLDTIDWLGEYRMAQRIQAKIDTLKEIQYDNSLYAGK